MNMKTYVTFGQDHTHEINGTTFDRDCVGIIHGSSATEGRELAFKYFNDKFCNTYGKEHFDKNRERWERLFPRGYIEVNPRLPG